MQRCQFCGTELPEQADFCGNCGSMIGTLPGMQSNVGRFPATDVQSHDASTFISDASLPTVLRHGSQQLDDTTWRGWSHDQDVQNSQLHDDRQTEENKSLLVDPFLPGIPLVQNTLAPPLRYSTPFPKMES